MLSMLLNYFDLLRQIYDEHGFESRPECVYNMDKTGVPLEPRPPRIVARKGHKKIRYRTSGQKAQITIIRCGNATGQYCPFLLSLLASNEIHCRPGMKLLILDME